MERSTQVTGQGSVEETGRVAVLVLGMHRSGTSAVSGVLNILGAETPGKLIPAAMDNERGFFENRRLVILNDRILSDLGSSWDDPLPLSHSWLASPVGRKAHRDLCTALREEFGNATFVTIKDPRICRIVPLWLSALHDTGLRAVAVLPARHPLEVANSTAGRNGTPRSQTLLSWLDHTLSAEFTTRELPRSFLCYDDLLTDWRTEMTRVGNDVGLAWSRDPVRVVDDISRFLGSDLRHHRAHHDSLNHDDPLERVCDEVWKAVSVFRNDPSSIEARQVFDRARDKVLSSVILLGPLVRGLMQHRRATEIEMSRQGEELQNLATDLSEKNAASIELTAELDRLDGDLREMTRLAETRSSMIDTLSGRIGILSEDNDLSRIQVHELGTELHRANSRLAAVEGSTSWRLTRPLRVVLGKFPTLRKAGRRTLRGSWWIMTGQFRRRIRERQESLDRAGLISSIASASSDQIVSEFVDKPLEEMLLASDPSQQIVVVQVPFDMPLPESSSRVAVILHLFHDELIIEILQYLKNLEHADLLISTDTEHKKQKIQNQLVGWMIGTVEVRIVPNHGHDIAPMIVAFKDVYERYEIVLYLHSKKFLHSPSLALWWSYLFESLLGSKEIVRSILCAFDRHPALGIVAAEHFEPVSHHINWAGNVHIAQDMAARMGFGINPDSMIDFPSGSMFWMRSAALRPLLALNLTFNDFPAGVDQIEANRVHAIERLFYFVCEAAGFRWLKIARPDFFSRPMKLNRVSSEDDLEKLKCGSMASVFASIDDSLLSIKNSNINDVIEAPTQFLLQLVQSRHLGIDLDFENITVIVGIVTYNNAEREMRNLFRSIKAASREGLPFIQVRTLVLDNGKSSQLWSGDIERTRHIESIGNVGFGQAHNHLMRIAFAEGADLYIAANPDGAFHPDAIFNLVRMSAANAHSALVEATQFPVEHPKPYDPATFTTPWASGACLLIPRQIFELTHGFDDSFFMYAEDVDLSWRTRAAGYEVKICPKALYLHAVTNRTVSAGTLKMIYESGSILARRWGSMDFQSWIDEQAKLQGLEISIDPVAPLPKDWYRFSDFSHHFSFAKARW